MNNYYAIVSEEGILEIFALSTSFEYSGIESAGSATKAFKLSFSCKNETSLIYVKTREIADNNTIYKVNLS